MRNYFLLVLLFCFCFPITTTAQQKGDYVPCEEMPYIMQQFNADYKALQLFYTPTGNDAPFGYGSDNYNGAASPGQRTRLEKLYKEYMAKLEDIDFEKLSQECKVDYILFRRDIQAKIDLSAKHAAAYEKIKAWIPFADTLFSMYAIRRRGGVLDGKTIAKTYADIDKQISQYSKSLRRIKEYCLKILLMHLIISNC